MGPLLSEWANVAAVGIVGGILCAWNPLSVEKAEEVAGQFSLSVVFKDIQLGHSWMFTGVYGPASSSNREEFWEELKGLKRTWPSPWVVGGDFDVIRFVDEKSSGGRINRSMRDFDEFVRYGNLRDSPLCNAKYT